MRNSGRYAFMVKKECRKESISCREARSKRGKTGRSLYAYGEAVIRQISKSVPAVFTAEPIHILPIYDSGILNVIYVNKMRSYDHILLTF